MITKLPKLGRLNVTQYIMTDLSNMNVRNLTSVFNFIKLLWLFKFDSVYILFSFYVKQRIVGLCKSDCLGSSFWKKRV